MKLKVAMIGWSVLLLASCKEEDVLVLEEKQQLEKQVYTLSEQLNSRDEELESIKNQLTELQSMVENSDLNEKYSELDKRLYMLEGLIEKLPNLEKRFAFVKGLSMNGTNAVLDVQFVNMFDDDEAPSGFSIEEEEAGRVTVDMDAQFFVLENMKMTEVPTLEEFQQILDGHERLYELYMSGKHILMMKEQYLP